MKRDSRTVVLSALLANITIAMFKFVVAAITGSAAMWSEGIHSSVDTGNQVMMLIGMRRGQRPPDKRHPFGHGKELYFWSLMVSVFIFGIGGGLSAYEGILRLLHPIPLQPVIWSYVVLGAAFCFESASFAIAYRAFIARHGKEEILKNIVKSKNPPVYTVLVEDFGAMIGLVIAAAGVSLSEKFGLPQIDGVASILIGVLLGAGALFLIRECRGLLVGEGVGRRTETEIRKITLEDPLVESVERPLTMYLGPENALLTIDVNFRSKATIDDVNRSIERIKMHIRERCPHLKRIYLEPAPR